MPNFTPGRIIPVADWLAEAKRRFGEDPLNWRFQCPICKHVQTLGDFKAIGAEPQSAYQECIGRHLQKPARDLAGTPGSNGKKSPCDYAAYGLFSSGIQVQGESGRPVYVFPFAQDVPMAETQEASRENNVPVDAPNTEKRNS